jgi:hypothetical protein
MINIVNRSDNDRLAGARHRSRQPDGAPAGFESSFKEVDIREVCATVRSAGDSRIQLRRRLLEEQGGAKAVNY